MPETHRIEYKELYTNELEQNSLFYGKEYFQFSENFLRMKFPAPELTPHDTPHDGGQVGGQISSLTARQKEVFEIIVAEPTISRKELSEKLGINESAVQKHTDALKKKKVIVREGETTGQWIIIGK